MEKRTLHFLILASITALIANVNSSPVASPKCLEGKHRPQLHFSPASNWLNDPNGMVYLNGEYHLFYQYHPDGMTWGPMHWGHAISTDLIHWEEYPIALYPDELGTIFSGSAVVDYRNTSGLQTGSTPPIIAIFTHDGASQQQSIAVSNDLGRSFQKYAGNPVLPNPGIRDFRDPKVAFVNEEWVMSLAVSDRISFYSSPDLKSWTLTSEFGANPPEGSHGGVWECPDILRFEFNGEAVWVLLVSINPGGPNLGSVTQYFLGEFDGKTFRKFDIDEVLWMDWGPDNYAGVTFANEPRGRSLLIGWMSNWLYGEQLPTAEWRGQMTLPRILELKLIDGKLRLASSTPSELWALRNPDQFYRRSQPLVIASGAVYNLASDFSFRTSLLEVDIEFDTTLAVLDPSANFQLCFFNGISQEICQGYDYGSNEIFLDRSKSGLVEFNPEFQRRATAKRETKRKTLTLKLFLDVSAVEMFVDEGLTVLTGLFYPDEPVQTGINISFNSANAENQLVLRSYTIRGLNSIHDC